MTGKPSRPMSGISVILTRGKGPPATAITDSTGVFEIYDLPRGPYTVSVRIPQRIAAEFRLCIGSARVCRPVPSHCGPR
jgi:hypothetical protein